MVPRPLPRPHHLLGRLPSYGDLARTRTAAPERSQSRLTRHGTRDDTSTRGTKVVTSACSEQAHMLCHSLPAARGCAVGRPRRRAAAHPLLRPPMRDYSPICPPRSSRCAEPPEEVGQRSRGSSRGWSPDRRGCPGSRASRHPRRGGHPVAPHWSWAILVVSSRLGAPANRIVPVWHNGLAGEHGTLAAAWRVAVSTSGRRPDSVW
jgi:hypothetical protein